MKKHLLKTLVILFGLTLLSSCMKDNPGDNATVYYGYQQIPNINEFMPERLLKAMHEIVIDEDTLDCLYYGDEPPKIEGSFLSESTWIFDIIKAPNSPYQNVPPLPRGDCYFKIFDQHKGIAKLTYMNPRIDPNNPLISYVENSNNETTYEVVTANPDFFINDPMAPAYFQNGNYQEENFHTVYIMGQNPYFTIYYYEILDNYNQSQPLNAVIVSGKIDTETIIVTDTIENKTDTIEQPVIKDLKWGIEIMKYYNETNAVSMAISMGFLAPTGDVFLYKPENDEAHVGEFHEQ